MTTKKWATFEDRVREIAGYIYSRPCSPQRVGGVNIDGVVKFDPEIHIFIEMTENRTLGKVREDIIKLQVAKAAAYSKGVLARCFCVVDGAITNAMKEAGQEHHIVVLSIDEFTKQFFDFPAYRVARELAPFGSSINPLTGDSDDTAYVPVKYLVEGRKGEVSSKEIGDFLRERKNVILLGEYGSGKSRCIREVFKSLSDTASSTFCYPIAIDLRKSWGLRQSGELIRRHFNDLALDNIESSAVKAFKSGSLAVLLDGFDEIGSQAWSNDDNRLKVIRAKSLEGVKDIVTNNCLGTLIAGREHYFPNADEMYAAIGMKPQDTIVIRSKDEFNDTELLEYFRNRDIEVDVPEWLPKRPLICQTISNLASDQLTSMFGEEGDEIAFWNHFIMVLCERDAGIHVSFDRDTIFNIFIYLARLTRSKSANVGPISLAELQSAFEAATGAAPIEEASIMLQRLPSLGRVSSESNDRQFVDSYILNGLRAKDIIKLCKSDESEVSAVCCAKWANPLDDLGQRVLAEDVSITEKSKLDFARKSISLGNTVLASDLVSSLIRLSETPIDFGGLKIGNGEFLFLTLGERCINNLSITDSYFGELAFPVRECVNTLIVDCIAQKITGISSASALPNWVRHLSADEFDSVESVSRIRRIGLSAPQEILIAIIRKTFFQKGAGRKEEALLRGLSKVSTKSVCNKILNIMIREALLTHFKGNEGIVYSPVRSNTQRMQKLLNELGGSEDPLWVEVSKL